MGSPVFQRSTVIFVRATTTTTAPDVRGQVSTEAPSTTGVGPDQAERAVQTWPAPSIWPPVGVRQTGGPPRRGQALRVGCWSLGSGYVVHDRTGPTFRVLAGLQIGRQLLRQRRNPTERYRCVHTRLRVPIQGDPAVRIPVTFGHQLCAVRTASRVGRGRERVRRLSGY